MGRIHVLPEHVANKIAAGEVVERPASVVKELLENALDAGARRIKIQVEAGGKKLIHITDDGWGMVRDDALLAFERHATSKIKNADDLLNVSTLGFRGEAMPSIASVSRLTLETAAASDPENIGTLIEISGGKILRVEDAGVPPGTSIAVRDLFFNIPARKKFLKAESTELSHIASLVTHYALAHPEMHFELHSAANAMLVAAPVADHAQRVFQIFGKEVLDQLVPLTAALPLEHVGLPQPPPWSRKLQEEDYQPPQPGELRLHGFISKPEIQKLNRNSIFIFVNGRLIRDRLVQHAITEAYRNILPPTLFPVVLLFLELPGVEVDVNVHPSKTEVRFRQNTAVHDFVRDSIRSALLKARPVPQFVGEIYATPSAKPALTSGSAASGEALLATSIESRNAEFQLAPPSMPASTARLNFAADHSITVEANAAKAMAAAPALAPLSSRNGTEHCGGIVVVEEDEADAPVSLTQLKPLGQIRNSFIVAADGNGLWIIDQHVAHERVLFERVLRQRESEHVESQRMLMPIIISLTPAQQAVFAEISEELRRNGFDVEAFGSRTIAVKEAPAGLQTGDVERMLHELLDHFNRAEQSTNLEKVRAVIAASIACHAAIKVNTPLEIMKMEWLLRELSKTACPVTCPHGRPVLLRYSLHDIQKAFKRI